MLVARARKAVITDEQVMELVRLPPESCDNVAAISRMFSVRPWEIEFFRQANNDDGKSKLRVIKGKTFTTRSAAKEKTELRWIEVVAVNGTTFDLVQSLDQIADNSEREKSWRFLTASALLAKIGS